jgi:hypothetical protein
MSLQTVSWLGVGLLVLAAVLLPRVWQEKAPDARGDGGARKSSDQGFAPSVHGRAWPPQSLDANPYLWLASRPTSPDIAARVLFGLLVLLWFCFLAAYIFTRAGKELFALCLFTAYALHQVGKYLVAVEATRQLGEDRRSGALELLLVTPLGDDQILSGQARALKRRSLGLKLLLLFVNVCMCLAVLAHPRGLYVQARDQAIFTGLFLGGILALVVDFSALQTVGIWMALRARSQPRAVLGTLGRVMLVPWAAFFLLVFLTITRAFSPSVSELVAVFAFWFLGGIINDLVFCAQARAGLDRGLRHWVAEGQTAGRQELFQAPTTNHQPR